MEVDESQSEREHAQMNYASMMVLVIAQVHACLHAFVTGIGMCFAEPHAQKVLLQSLKDGF